MAFIGLEIWNLVQPYVIGFLCCFILLSYILKGFLFPYLKAKRSRGRLVLVHVRSATSTFWHTGEIVEEFLIYTDRVKEERRIVFRQIDGKYPGIYRVLGVDTVNVDDEKNSIILANGEMVTGFDAVRFQSLFKRCLYKPATFDGKEKIILFLIIGLILITLFLVFMVFSINGKVSAIGQLVSNLGPSVAQGTVA